MRPLSRPALLLLAALPLAAQPPPAPVAPPIPGLAPLPDPSPPPAAAFDPGKASFSLRFKDETSPYRIAAAFVMPGESLEIEVKEGHGAAYEAGAERGVLETSGATAWRWVAPEESGLHPIVVRRSGADSIVLNAFVLVPASRMQGESLEGYRIGKYPRKPLKGMRFYGPPKGYIRVDSALAQARVSPHFRLGQFLCKQSQGFPSYLILKERLVLKLEAVLEEVNKEGHPCSTFHVMSGYRTPWYNKRLGNVKLSAHQYGGAADVFIDVDPVDGNMDDLNRDGVSDGKDSRILFDIVDRMSLNRYYLPFLGGVGHYNRNSSHGPFVHVDVRGFRAIW